METLNSEPSAAKPAAPPLESPDFSLVLGGPLYQLYLLTRLAKPPLDLLFRRMLIIPLLAWLPLALLTVWAGHATGGIDVPFLMDLDAHVRFLVALPILIVAELIVHTRMKVIVGEFVEREIISPEDLPRFSGILHSAMRVRNSVLLEVLLLVIVFTGGYWLWWNYLSLNTGTWYAEKTTTGLQLTTAGYWYAWVSLPILRFLSFRWYVRLGIWYWFVWRVSRLPLRLNALHPDRAGGLGFLAGSAQAFSPVLVAHTVFVSAVVGNRIFHAGATLPEFKLELLGIVLFLMLIVLAPLVFFLPQMIRAKLDGTRAYGALASQYVADFRRKWIDGKASGETLIGNADIQSLADLSNSFNVAAEMQLLPFNRKTVLFLAIVIALPLLPLILTMIPLEEMIDRAVRLMM